MREHCKSVRVRKETTFCKKTTEEAPCAAKLLKRNKNNAVAVAERCRNGHPCHDAAAAPYKGWRGQWSLVGTNENSAAEFDGKRVGLYLSCPITVGYCAMIVNERCKIFWSGMIKALAGSQKKINCQMSIHRY